MSRVIINDCLYDLFDEKFDIKVALYPMFMSIYHMPEKVQLVKSYACYMLMPIYIYNPCINLSLNKTLVIQIVLYPTFVSIYLARKKSTRAEMCLKSCFIITTKGIILQKLIPISSLSPYQHTYLQAST